MSITVAALCTTTMFLLQFHIQAYSSTQYTGFQPVYFCILNLRKVLNYCFVKYIGAAAALFYSDIILE